MVNTEEDENSPSILTTVVRWMLSIGIFMSIVLYGGGGILVLLYYFN